MKNFLVNKFTVKFQFKDIFFFCLLLGLVFGNLFGIHFSYVNWNFFSLLLVALFLEFGNILTSSLKNKQQLKMTSFFQQVEKSEVINNFIILLFKSIKRGFLLGIFIEAFKVGS